MSEELVEVRARTLYSLLEWELCSDHTGEKGWDGMQRKFGFLGPCESREILPIIILCFCLEMG